MAQLVSDTKGKLFYSDAFPRFFSSFCLFLGTLSRCVVLDLFILLSMTIYIYIKSEGKGREGKEKAGAGQRVVNF